MPAAAVIPAPIAYIKVVAVKKLVVEFVSRAAGTSLAAFHWRSAGRPAGGRGRVSERTVGFASCGSRSRQGRGGPTRNPAAVLFTECRGGPARLL